MQMPKPPPRASFMHPHPRSPLRNASERQLDRGDTSQTVRNWRSNIAVHDGDRGQIKVKSKEGHTTALRSDTGGRRDTGAGGGWGPPTQTRTPGVGGAPPQTGTSDAGRAPTDRDAGRGRGPHGPGRRAREGAPTQTGASGVGGAPTRIWTSGLGPGR